MVMKDRNRLARLLNETRYIRSGNGVTADELAETFSTTPEQIYQDLQDLSLAGIPICFDNRGFKILPSYFNTANALNVEESVLLVQGVTLLEDQGIINRDKADQLLGKLFLTVSDHCTRQIYTLHKTALDPTPVRNEVDAHCMEFLNHAVLNQARIRLRYFSRRSEQPSWRELSPYTLVYRKDTWYVIGFCHRHEEVRTFKVCRIQQYEQSTQPFHADPDFDVDRYLLYTWNIIGGESQVVLIRFDREVGRLILEKQITNGHVWKENGSVYLKLLVAGLDEISWWVMQYGEHAEVLQPQELRRMLALRIAKMSNRYKDSFSSVSSKKIIPLY